MAHTILPKSQVTPICLSDPHWQYYYSQNQVKQIQAFLSQSVKSIFYSELPSFLYIRLARVRMKSYTQTPHCSILSPLPGNRYPAPCRAFPGGCALQQATAISYQPLLSSHV